jgi:TRAP transporter 4TM/12TM fusion protein
MLRLALDPVKAILRAAIVMTVVAWIVDIPGRLGAALFTEQMLVAVLGFALALCFLVFPWRARHKGEIAVAEAEMGRAAAAADALDAICAALALSSCLYVAIRYQSLITELVYRPWDGVIVATIIVALVLEATRRVTGLALVLIVLALCAHALLGWMLPDQFASRPISLSRLMVYLGIDTNALLGSTLQIAVLVVTPFIIMGQVLTRSGGADFFADISSAAMGRFRGGAAKVAVFGSALFGMVSGSAVANVASVGTVTIPLMKRAGFAPHIAASVEAVGSTGGQLMPPIMGAAAFLMAEYLQVPYAEVMIAAIIPSYLYYLALFVQVDLESAKSGIRGTPREQIPSALAVLRAGWHFPVPFIVLIAALMRWNMEAEYAALLAILVLIGLSMLFGYKGKRLTLRDSYEAIMSAGEAVIDIIVVTAISGLLIGALNLTGVAFSLTQQLLTVSGGSLLLLLILTAFVAFVLGLGLPTVGVYVILATLAAPALVQAGLQPIQAHMYVLFHGILSMLTPPVALAAFAAAAIAKADQWKTGWTASRMGWAAYFIPFFFAYSPLFIMRGPAHQVIAALAVATLGIIMGSIAVVGYVRSMVPPIWRLAYGAIAFMLLIPSTAFAEGHWINAAGVALAIIALWRELTRNAGTAASLAGGRSTGTS